MRSPAGAEVAGQRRASTSATAIPRHTGNILREAIPAIHHRGGGRERFLVRERPRPQRSSSKFGAQPESSSKFGAQVMNPPTS
eukprot:346631-Amphidinium_carterae.1